MLLKMYMYVYVHVCLCAHNTCTYMLKLLPYPVLSLFFAIKLDGDLMLAPGFPIPPNSDYVGYKRYIDENLPPESPTLYGLHPNAEIGFLTTTSENLFRTLLEMQPRDSSGGGGAASSREEKVGTNSYVLLVWYFHKVYLT